MGIIYFLFDPRETEPKLRYRYVGKTCKSEKVRLNCHLADARAGRKGHKNNWIRNLLSQNVTPDLQIIEIHDDNQELLNREIWWIAHLREQGYNLVNNTDGGEGIAGWSHSEATKQKIREKAIGRPVSDETRIKKRNSMIGKKHSEDAKKRHSLASSGNKNGMYGKSGSLNPMYGKSHGTESKEKIGLSNSKITDAELLQEVNSGATSAEISHKFNMSEKTIRFRCAKLGVRCWSKRDTSGKNNPMYGRHEPKSPETKQKMREARLRYNAMKSLDKSQ